MALCNNVTPIIEENKNFSNVEEIQETENSEIARTKTVVIEPAERPKESYCL